MSDYELPKTLRYTCLGFQALTVLIVIASLVFFFTHNAIDKTLDIYWERVSAEAREVVTYTESKKWILQTLATISYFAPVLILIGAFRVLGTLRTGTPFRVHAAKTIRFLGMTIIAYALSRIFMFSASVYAMTYDNPPGQKELSIAVDTNTLSILLIGTIIFIIGHVHIYAVKIADENRQFV